MARPTKLKNQVLNSYISPESHEQAVKILSRLPRDSILSLALLWLKLPQTSPVPRRDARAEEKLAEIRQRLKALKGDGKTKTKLSTLPKAKVVDILVNEIWQDGFNLLQMAQADCQGLVDRPALSSWNWSTAQDMRGNEHVITVEPQDFLDNLVEHLNAVYKTHIYICRHPHLQLLILRVQAFDVSLGDFSKPRKDTQMLTPSKRFFLAIPPSSPHIIHTPFLLQQNSPASQLGKHILQSVARSISSASRPVTLRPSNTRPVRELQSMAILKGVSRFSQALGRWQALAADEFDVSPLAVIDSNALAEKAKKRRLVSARGAVTCSELAGLKFKGTRNLSNQSELRQNPIQQARSALAARSLGIGRQKRRRRGSAVDDITEQEILINDDLENPEDLTNLTIVKSEYSSLVPVQFVEFTLQTPVVSAVSRGPFAGHTPGLKLRISGADVFGGLHELASAGYANVRDMPDWLCGECGCHDVVVTGGSYTVKDETGGVVG